MGIARSNSNSLSQRERAGACPAYSDGDMASLDHLCSSHHIVSVEGIFLQT
jgi:hypothetical protein